MNTMDERDYDCGMVRQLLYDYLDRELSPVELDSIDRHLESCPDCSSASAFEESVLEELKSRLRRTAAPESLRKRLDAVYGEAGGGPNRPGSSQTGAAAPPDEGDGEET